MTTFLRRDLLALLPLQYQPLAERRNRINEAINLIYKAWDSDRAGFELNASDLRLAEGFVAWLVFEFASDSDIYDAMFNGGLNRNTILSEWGDQVPLEEVRFRDPELAQGMGVSLRKADSVPFLKPALESAINELLEDRPETLLELKAIDIFAEQKKRSAPPKFGLRRTFARILLPVIEKENRNSELALLRRRYPLSVYRFFAYIQPSEALWSKAWERFQASPYSGHIDIPRLLIRISPTEASNIFDMHESTRTANQYLVLGKKAQEDGLVLQRLARELQETDSAPTGMDITHGIAIAACKNPAAVEIYATIRSNRLTYPRAESDPDVLPSYHFDLVNEAALKAMIKEYLESASKPRDGSAWSRSRADAVIELLTFAPGLEPAAQYYLESVALHGISGDKAYLAALMRQMLERSGKWQGATTGTQTIAASVRDSQDDRLITKAAAIYGVAFASCRGLPESPIDTSEIPADEQWILKVALWDLLKGPIVAANRETIAYLLAELRPRRVDGSGIDGFLKRLEERYQHDYTVANVNEFATRAIVGSPVVTAEDVAFVVNHVAKNRKIDQFDRATMITAFECMTEATSANATIGALSSLPVLLGDRSYFVAAASLQAIDHCIDLLDNTLPRSVHSNLQSTIKKHLKKPGVRQFGRTYNVSGLKASSQKDIAQVVLAKLEKSRLEEEA